MVSAAVTCHEAPCAPSRGCWRCPLPRCAAAVTAAQDQPAAGSKPPSLAQPVGGTFASSGWDVSLSPYTYHFHPRRTPGTFAIGLLKRLEDYWIVGGSYFSSTRSTEAATSMSASASTNCPDFRNGYLQWNVGILYGYVGEYRTGAVQLQRLLAGVRAQRRLSSATASAANRSARQLGLMFTLIFPIPKGGFDGPPRSAFGAPLRGASSRPAKPDPRRPLDSFGSSHRGWREAR